MRERILSWGDDFTIKDDAEREAFYVDGKVFSFGDKLAFKDMEGNELVRIEQKGLVDVEKVPSDKGPPRKVYSLNAQGRDYLDEFWRTWSFLSERLEQLHEGK